MDDEFKYLKKKKRKMGYHRRGREVAWRIINEKPNSIYNL